MTNSYNFKNIFFHRPLFTPDNIRLFVIILTVAFFSILTVTLSTKWAVNLPRMVTSEKIKSSYITFLSQERVKLQKESNKKLLAGSNSPSAIKIDNKIREKMERNPLKKAPFSKTFSKKHANQQKNSIDYPGKRLAIDVPSGAIISSAVENVPGAIDYHSSSIRAEHRMSFSNNDEYLKKLEGPIQIPEPKIVRLASVNGNRNPQETYAIIAGNEMDIQYCFEKYARYNPDFSGDLKISFIIHPDGYVIPSSIKILNSNITDPRIIRCIKRSLRRWKNFPSIALEDGIFRVTRKYVF